MSAAYSILAALKTKKKISYYSFEECGQNVPILDQQLRLWFIYMPQFISLQDGIKLYTSSSLAL